MKPVQVFYQIYNRLKLYKIRRVFIPIPDLHGAELNFSISTTGIQTLEVSEGQLSFNFLNQQIAYPIDNIKWDQDHPELLWSYNLNYFEWLCEGVLDVNSSLRIIDHFIETYDENKVAQEPYPTSLRMINWIKFFASHKIMPSREIQTHMMWELKRGLSPRLEYHLLANHLLENAIALVFGAYFFEDPALHRKGISVLRTQLAEQILSDGGHYELSPMYHRILLFRMLDLYQLAQKNPWKSSDIPLIEDKVLLMLGWLNQMLVGKQVLSHFNDSVVGVAPTVKAIQEYAEELRCDIPIVNLGESGYRKLELKDSELMVDIGEVNPDYQPGHAHADTFNFEFYYRKTPIIVDPGTSTYQAGPTRQLERSTSYHNTLTLGQENSSEVWGAFRVARRARVHIEIDRDDQIKVSHSGYLRFGLKVARTFQRMDDSFLITDVGEWSGKAAEKLYSQIHFHPDCEVRLDRNECFVGNVRLHFRGYSDLQLEIYKFAEGYNSSQDASKIIATVDLNSSIRIYED